MWAVWGQFSIMRLTVPIPLDNDGIRIDVLTNRLRKLKMEGRTPKFIYLVPNFQNPSGICMSLERRRQVLELAGSTIFNSGR